MQLDTNMDPITLRATSTDGAPLEATFLPGKGMNLISYKRGDLEVIDQSTRPDFEERCSGLGPLIGPHFYRRHPSTIPTLPDPSRFPHIAHAKGDPFSHGVGRYAPWTFEVTENTLSGKIEGKDEWNGVTLADIEGQNFTMTFDAALKPTGLALELSVVSDTDSIVGIHYYWHLPKGTGRVFSSVQKKYLDLLEEKTVPDNWAKDHQMTFDLAQAADFTFYPHPHPREGEILLDAEDYRLKTTYTNRCQENSWQLYHPKGASFVCIEPVSSQNPRRANLSISDIHINLEILV